MNRIPLFFIASSVLLAAVPRPQDPFGALPLFFEPAERASGVEYVARGAGLTAGITARGALLRLDGSAAVEMTLAGSACKAIEGTDPAPGVSNYLRGRDPKNWRTAVPHFSRVSCRSAYPGIDVVYYGSGRRLEYDFAVAAGADPSRIRIRYRGAGAVRIGPEGDLILETAAGELVQKRPLAWQDAPGGRREVAARYVRAGDGEFRLALGAYDRSLPLVVDPVLEYLTYLGGGKDDIVRAIAVDAQGNAYIAGSTASADFPGTAGSFQSKLSGGTDIFVAKLNPSGTALAYATFVGGIGGNDAFLETAMAIAVDAQGNAYVVGDSYSQDFPVTAGAWQTTTYWNSNVAFKLDASGSRLLYSTFLEPSSNVFVPVALALKNGAAYIAGTTQSVGFYGTAGAYQRDFGGGYSDGVILALNPDGTQQLFATLLGGSGDDSVTGIRLDDAGNIYVAGSTSSPNFPVAGGLHTSYQGATDAFVAKLDPNGGKLLFSVLAGGAKSDSALALALDASRNVIVSGRAQDLSALTALKQPANLDPVGALPACCGFLLKLTPDGASVLSLGYSKAPYTQLQADLSGYFYALAATATGFVSGGAPAANDRWGTLVKLSPSLDRLLFCAAFVPVGNGGETELGVGPLGHICVAGETAATTLATTPGVLQPTAPPVTDTPPWNQPWPRDGFVFRADLSQFQSTNFFIPASSLSLKYRMGDPEPAPVSIPVSFSGPALGVIASTDVPGVEGSVTGQPAALRVRINPAAVKPGKFTSTVTLSVPALPSATIPIPIALEVLARPTYTLGASKLDFRSQEGLPGQSQTVSIATDFHGQYFSSSDFQVKSDQSWLWGSVSSRDSGAIYELRVSAGAMAAGTYKGTLTVSLGDVPDSTHTISVTYTVALAPTMTLSANRLFIRATVGQPPPPPQTVTVSSSTPGFPFSFYPGGYSFFSVTTSGNTTPATISISADHTGLGPGIWTNRTSVNLAGQPSQYIQTTLVVSTTAPLDVTPAEINYSFMRGADYLQKKTLTLTGSEELPVSYSTDQPWLTVVGESPTPASVELTFNPEGLAEDLYKANLTINVLGRDELKRVVPVTFELSDVPKSVVTPSQIAFTYRMGDPAPPAQVIKITSPNRLPACFRVNFWSQSWLNLKENQWGCTPYQLTLSLNLDKVTPGHFTSQITVQPDYRNTGGGKVAITLDVAASDAPPPVLSAVVNAASYEGGEIAPGEIVTLFGTDLGPKDLVYGAIDGGKFPTSAAGTRVLFDGVAAPVVYSSALQVSAIVPYSLAGKTRTEIAAEYNGVRTQPAVLSVAGAAPGLFAADASGKGQGAIQNYVEATHSVEYNSAARPAARGSVVTLYATGEGQLAPAQADGVVTGGDVARPLLPVRVSIGGEEAEVLYAGTSPGSVAGLLQINVRVPSGAPAGNAVPVVIHVGDHVCPSGVTMAIK